jgi:hypothetical protein
MAEIVRTKSYNSGNPDVYVELFHDRVAMQRRTVARVEDKISSTPLILADQGALRGLLFLPPAQRFDCN